MKSFLIFILLGLLVFIGWQYLIVDNGYVLIEFLNYSIETSVPIFVGCLIILYFVFRIFGVVWRSPKMIREKMEMRGKERSVKLHHEAQALIGQGLNAKAAKKLDSSILSDGKNINAVIDRMNLAAKENDFKSISEIAEKLILEEPKHKTYIFSHACKLLIGLDEYSLAQKFADNLIEDSSKNSEARNLLFMIKSAVEDPSIIGQLPKYAKTIDGKILSKTILKLSRKLKGQKTVEDLFGSLPRSLDKQPDFITAKCELWMAKEDHIKAETELKKAIPSYWNENHISLYSKLLISNLEGLSSQLEIWLKERPRDSNLWLAASRVARREGLWSKAKQCLVRSIEFKNDSQKQTELALILAQLGEKDEAFDVLNNISEIDGPTSIS
tara:strand:+ start:4933 stop:6084 length:1152 start_codon:yes stop_codon:yes gene_type:complete